jgi:hypothetical protein
MKIKSGRMMIIIFVALIALGEVSYSPPVQVVPGPGLPAEVECMDANNNLDLVRFKGRLFLAFRTAPTHFAGKNVRHYILSSEDGKEWEYEAEVFMGSDMREPRFLVLGDKLMYYFFQAGKNPFAFSPQHIFAMERRGPGDWTESVKVYNPHCVLWRAKYRQGRAFITAYCGEGMYTGGNAQIGIHFLTTKDGYNFEPVNPERPVVSTGGSETAFEFDEQGTLYLAIRNEAGDGKTWGSKVCKADPEDLAEWKCKDTPYKYDSPLMFRHNDDIYLIARRNIDGTYDKHQQWLPNPIETLYYLARYWWTQKRTALYKLDKENLTFEPILDFPSKGDTAFPALVRLDEDSYLMFNYSSPLEGKDRVWMTGQLTGTRIYSTIITFEQNKKIGDSYLFLNWFKG